MKSLICFLLFWATTPAYSIPAEGYLGALLGADFSGVQTSGSYGFIAGVFVAPHTSLGFFGSYFNRNLNMAAEVNYFFPLNRQAMAHLGWDAGIARDVEFLAAGTLPAQQAPTFFISGPEAGVDIPVGPSGFSVGMEFHYLMAHLRTGSSTLLFLAALKTQI